MKLRNKKTGEIIDLDEWTVYTDASCFSVENDCDETAKSYRYRTLAELNEEWEDYKPAEPLIKDKKICKAVRAWAEANDVFEVQFGYDDGGNWSLSDTTHEERICIEFKSDLPLFLNGCRRTIKELCREEEE